MAAIDIVNRVFREFKRYTGDGLPGEPIGAPLPIGDPQSGVNSPKKSEIREALLAPLVEATADADRAEIAAGIAEAAAAGVTVGLAKARCVTTTNITLSAPGATLDDLTMSVGQTFLAAGQTSAPQNGLYVWNGAAVAATRHPVYTTHESIAGQYFSVLEGTENGDTLWRCLSDSGGTIGVDALVIEKYTAALVVRRQFFTASGTYTPHPKMLYAELECLGAGGGGGGVATSGAGTAGGAGGGGSGSLAKRIASKADIGASKAVTVGAAGTGAAAGNNAGGDGGTSSVGSLCTAPGGKGGGASFGSLGGAGGLAGTGDISIPGNKGGQGPIQLSALNPSLMIGVGAPSVYGGSPGAFQVQATANGAAGNGYGAGGNGGMTWNAGGPASGGAGAPGLVVITEMCSG